MSPCYYALDCIPTADGRYQVIDVQGGVGAGLDMLDAAYGGKAAARARLRPYLQRLGEVAQGKLILFIQDSFAAGQTFPDDFFDLVQRFIAYCPITDWVPDLQVDRRRDGNAYRTPEVEQIGVFLDPLAGRLRLKIAYCSSARVDYQRAESVRARSASSRPMVLLSGFRERARRKETSVILAPEEIGVGVFSGRGERFPDDLKQQEWFPLVNPPLLDALLENKWLLPLLLEGTPAARMLPRWMPVGMGLRTAAEVMEFTNSLHAPNAFPLAALKPSHFRLSPGLRFLDRTALRALAARQPEHRLPARQAEALLSPRIAHSYEEISRYRGKLLDNLLRAPGAEVHDHGDGTFHYSAPYPFLETTVAVLQEYVEARPIRSRRTGKFHRGSMRVVIFDRKIVAALYRLDQEVDDGTFRDLTRPDVSTFFEGVAPDEEAALQEQLGSFIDELERQFAARVRSEEDLRLLREHWILDQTARD
ncbi:MAG TPA: hypothetical protein VK689_03205 [Armatimonadota bacterium]|nr:hypothetical protein [Armatimonadota bacterium]